MAASRKGSVIYSVAPNGRAGLDCKEVGSSPAVTAAYRTLLPLSFAGRTYLVGHQAGSTQVDIFRFYNKSPWLKRVAKPKVATGTDLVEVFILGNRPYLVAYAAKKGILSVYAIADDFSLSKPYEFFRNHEPSLSQEFTTLSAFTLYGQVVLLGYRGDNGYVAMYTAAVVAGAPAGVAPIVITPAWAHQWAKGWGRFAFFQLGGENFFFKINTWKWNVNIDHVLDDLGAGTVEVGTQMDPDKKFESADVVRAFGLGNGDPYFATYTRKSGQLSLNRFNSDCLGWTGEGGLTAKINAAQVCPIGGTADRVFLVVV